MWMDGLGTLGTGENGGVDEVYKGKSELGSVYAPLYTCSYTCFDILGHTVTLSRMSEGATLVQVGFGQV
jgi:hypothetical protein